MSQGGLNEHSSCIEARRKKPRRTVKQVTAAVERHPNSSKGFGRFGRQRSDTSQEARDVGRSQGENLQGRQEAMGKIQITGEEGSCGLICSFRPARNILRLRASFSRGRAVFRSAYLCSSDLCRSIPSS